LLLLLSHLLLLLHLNSIHLRFFELFGNLVLLSYFILKLLVLTHEVLHVIFDHVNFGLSSHDSFVFLQLFHLLLLVGIVNIWFFEVISHFSGLYLSVCFWLCFCCSLFLWVGRISIFTLWIFRFRVFAFRIGCFGVFKNIFNCFCLSFVDCFNYLRIFLFLTNLSFFSFRFLLESFSLSLLFIFLLINCFFNLAFQNFLLHTFFLLGLLGFFLLLFSFLKSFLSILFG